MTTDEVAKNTSIIERYDISIIEPLNWWIGFKNQTLQLLVHHSNISERTPVIFHEGVSIEKVHLADSPNYLFIDLVISELTKAGKFNIIFKQDKKEDLIHTYELKSREKPSEDYIGFDSSDAIYLITPDRFANGNPNNDIIEILNEKTIDRNNNNSRHGGDILGIINHLNYIEDLGFTAIWPTPLLTNDMYQSSYHGYAITNFYQIDPRFGCLEDYKTLSLKMSEKGMKLIMDQVVNHCGLEHWWMKDLPFKNWINHQENYIKNKDNWDDSKGIITSHRRTTNQDIYASEIDKNDMSEGWFVSAMPDLNQRNPFMAKYTIQNSIWWIETANLGGIRQDTYSYPDKNFMSRWAGDIMNEYPNFSIVGEEWTNNPLLIAYWQQGNPNRDGYNSNLKSPMDFAMQEKIVSSLNQEESWDSGFIEIYKALANDFAYVNPKDIVVFPDNHDMSRIFTQLNGDVAHTKMAISYLCVLPRIPQIYYGTEILMNDFDNPGNHGLIRSDFPGGWSNDNVNAFTGKGLTDTQKDMQIYIKKLLNYRKSSKAIHKGKTIHFTPNNGIYLLFRILNNEIVIHIMNKNNTPVKLNLLRFNEIGLKGRAVKNIITNYQFFWGNNITLTQKGSTILSTKLK
ncbi:alpha-amlyase [Pseudalgibacter alginicilyticus]|uniref:Alpha-amlyase n=1 Tax=Pseudalgibacter alginicilyticus TaxID=1736674 RepID=A0A0P0CF71_9FLAO|nr:glycoside hydrolase family 13 protein [Pseudalgibacter alginicilyticus]ALJ04679.1 alpha-amlyase [Pseudalgibacter alginicilyticus]